MFLFILIGFIIYFFFFSSYKIKFKTFTKKGVPRLSNLFGVYCYCGKQGQGKTYSVVEFLNNFKVNNLPIYANLTSLKGVEYTYFNGLQELLKLNDKTDIIIFYDEIFSILTKSSKMSTDVLNFLSQMRKRRIIFITTAQEWLEINMTLRRYCRYQINCRIISKLGLNILFKEFRDATQMKWSNDENEYIAPLIEFSISKLNKEIVELYNTYEQITDNK